jgi:transcriptional regulator GlxA family with amidase domain
LIENTQKNLTTVAIETGFCDASHFSRQFRAAFGFSPSDLRSERATFATPRPEPSSVPPRA